MDVPVVVGTSGIIDGYNASYAKSLSAAWEASGVFFSPRARFGLTLECTYLSGDSGIFYLGLDHLGSVVLLRLVAKYHIGGDFSYWTHRPLTPLLVYEAESRGSDFASVSVREAFRLPDPTVRGTLQALEIQVSWLRVFQDDHGTKYYQWMQGSGGRGSQTGASAQSHHRDSGDFLVYRPFPESSASLLREFDFDYVSWTRERFG